ncbi:MAG: AI-2E family transporter [Verrucomicrobiae bacterium]|nr:AI-2E family transporter [Verrucomicrobiae bacterium]
MKGEEKSFERLAGSAMAVFFSLGGLMLLLAGCYVVMRPFLAAVLWAAILCFSTWPFYLWLDRRLKGRRNLAAMLMTLLVMMVVVVPLALLGASLADDIKAFYKVINQLLHEGMPPPPSWIGEVPVVGGAVESYWRGVAHNGPWLAAELRVFLSRHGSWLLSRGLDAGQGVMQLLLSVFIAFFFYRDGEAILEQVHGSIERLAGDRTRNLLQVAGGTVKGVVYGIFGTALAQGVLAGFGLWVSGVPMALLLGLLTFFLSIIPGGPPLVWLPATGWLFCQGRVGAGIFMGMWGFFVVSTVDNFLKPYLISRGSNLPFALVFLGVLGGALAFGAVGIFAGPTLLAVGYSLLKGPALEKGIHEK